MLDLGKVRDLVIQGMPDHLIFAEMVDAGYKGTMSAFLKERQNIDRCKDCKFYSKRDDVSGWCFKHKTIMFKEELCNDYE